MADEKKWAVDRFHKNGDKETTLLTDRELDQETDRIAAERAAGDHVDLRLATDEEREQQRERGDGREDREQPEHGEDRGEQRDSGSHEQEHAKGDEATHYRRLGYQFELAQPGQEGIYTKEQEELERIEAEREELNEREQQLQREAEPEPPTHDESTRDRQQDDAPEVDHQSDSEPRREESEPERTEPEHSDREMEQGMEIGG